MIVELVLKRDQVGLPGIGTFVAEMVPASFSDKGYTINPPYRRLNFYTANMEEDALAEFYAHTNGVDPQTSKDAITKFLADLKLVLINRRTIVLPGLGKLRATKENNIFFVPDESLDIFPEGYGLPPVSLKTHVETSEEIAIPFEIIPETEISVEMEEDNPETQVTFEAKEEEPETEITVETKKEEPEAEVVFEAKEEEPETEITVETKEGEPEAEVVFEAKEEEPETEENEPEAKVADEAKEKVFVKIKEEKPVMVEKLEAEAEAMEQEFGPKLEAEAEAMDQEFGPKLEPDPKRFRWWIPILMIIGVAFVALCAFMVLATIAPDFIDSILYTPEELEIINY